MILIYKKLERRTKSSFFFILLWVIYMNIRNKINNYLEDKEYKITFINNQVNINNYIEIIDFNTNTISIKHNKGITKIIGKDLVVSKMIDNEILITGVIKEIEVK